LELPNLGQNSRTDWSCFGTMWLRLALHLFLLLLCSYYALTLIGPREAKTGDPRDNVLTATLATILPIRVFMIACLLDCAPFDRMLKPALRLPAKNDCTAAPAFTCVIKASAVPVSITFIPNVLGALLRLLLLRLRTIPPLRGILYLTTWFITFTHWTRVLITRYMIDCPFMITLFAP